MRIFRQGNHNPVGLRLDTAAGGGLSGDHRSDRVIHIFHRYGPWKLTGTSALIADGTWRRYAIRRCRKCSWSKTRLTDVVHHRMPPVESSGSSSGGTT